MGSFYDMSIRNVGNKVIVREMKNQACLRQGIVAGSQLLSVNDHRWDATDPYAFSSTSVNQCIQTAPLPIKMSFKCPLPGTLEKKQEFVTTCMERIKCQYLKTQLDKETFWERSTTWFDKEVNKRIAQRFSFVVTNSGVEKANGTYVERLPANDTHNSENWKDRMPVYDGPNGHSICYEGGCLGYDGDDEDSGWLLEEENQEDSDYFYSVTTSSKSCVPPAEGWKTYAREETRIRVVYENFMSFHHKHRRKTTLTPIGKEPAPTLMSYSAPCENKNCSGQRKSCEESGQHWKHGTWPSNKKCCTKYKDTAIHFLPCTCTNKECPCPPDDRRRLASYDSPPTDSSWAPGKAVPVDRPNCQHALRRLMASEADGRAC